MYSFHFFLRYSIITAIKQCYKLMFSNHYQEKVIEYSKEKASIMKETKTNVMRILKKEKIEYTPYFYEPDPKLTGEQIASMLDEPINCVFKTLVCKGKSRQLYAFLIPVAKELDLKLAAKACGEKEVEMLPLKDLLPATGYVHGGCSPIGMKKMMKHYIDDSALLNEYIFFSGGKVGTQVKLKTSSAIKVAELVSAPIAKNPDIY